MASITLKNLPDARLKGRAAKNHRSINSEAILTLEMGLRTMRRSPEEILARLRMLRESVRGISLADEVINRAKRKGRP